MAELGRRALGNVAAANRPAPSRNGNTGIPTVIDGLLVGFGIAQALVLIAEGLGWDEKPRSSRLDRLVQCLKQLIDQAGQ
jgi:hypothetical protein